MKKASTAFFGTLAARNAPIAGVVTHRVSDFVALTKPRLNFLVVVTAAVGYYLGAGSDIGFARLLEVVAGIAMVAGGAAGLNQVYERETDRLMWRTRTRPLAARRLNPQEAAIFSIGLAAIGVAVVAARSNGLAALLTVLTLVSYNLIYTPMKRRS